MILQASLQSPIKEYIRWLAINPMLALKQKLWNIRLMHMNEVSLTRAIERCHRLIWWFGVEWHLYIYVIEKDEYICMEAFQWNT